MLSGLELIGFQSHHNSVLEFSKGTNAIIGPSRAGKTCILRALQWLANNRPIGIDSFISHGKKEVSVTLKLDGRTITRKKSSKENVYVLDGEIFSGIGTDVPAPIAELLNLSDLNVSGQFDVPFLLFDSPGQVARVLNRVVHLEAIDTALANVAALKRQNDQDTRTQGDRARELSELEASFPDLGAAEEFIADLEGQERDRARKEHDRDSLSGVQGRLTALRGDLRKTRITPWVEEEVIALGLRQGQRDQLEYTLKTLAARQANLAKLRFNRQELVPALGQESWVSELMTRNYLLEKKKRNLTKLLLFRMALGLARGELIQKTAIIKQEEEEFVRRMPDVCPLCGK